MSAKKPKGQWAGPHDALARRALRDVHVDGLLALDIMDALSRAGVLVSTAFYIPTFDELYDNWHMLRMASMRCAGCRWVMCPESWAALVDRYRSSRVVEPAHWDGALNVAEPEVGNTITYKTVYVIDTLAGMLFGVPVRLDPAARRPMWEVVE